MQTLSRIRWVFTERQNGKSPYWTWARLHLDGNIDTQSDKFPSYGEAMHDAICRGGFQPRSESWSVTAASGISSYFNTEPSVQNGPQSIDTNPRTDQPPPRAQSPPGNPSKRKGR